MLNLFIIFFTAIKLRGGGDELFLNPEQVKMDEKHFAVGATCKMYKGSLASFGKFGDIPIALKESIVPVTRRVKRSIEKEVGLFKHLDHQNVIKFYGIERSKYMLAYELMAKRITIDEEEIPVFVVRMLLDEMEDNISWNIRIHIAHSGAEGLAYLHSKNIIHRDVKAANFFNSGGPTNTDWKIKIGDFGEAVYHHKQTTLTMTSSQPSQGRNARKESSRGLVGTVPFLAPEIARPGAKHTQASDVYSFALFLYELAYPSKPHPWHGVCDIPELIVSTAEKGLRPPLSELNIEGGQSGSFLHLITQCWKASASERPNMSEISTSLKEIACSDTSDLEGQSSPTTTPINADVDTDAVDENIISVLPLSYHQNKVIEDASEVLAQGFAANGGVLDQDLELVQDLKKNASALDGTNSCSFLTMKIIDNLYTTNSEAFRNATTLKNTIEKIITTFPTEVNRLRDISKHFSVDEAYEILHAQQLLLRRYNFKESLSTLIVGQSAEGVTELEDALRHMANKS